MTSIRSTTYLTPKTNFATGLTELDARIVPFERCNGHQLNELIHASVNHSQKWLETELPSILRITQKQHASLNDYTEEMFTVTDRMFRFISAEGKTLGVAEVIIDKEIDTVDEIGEVMETSEELLAQNDFSKMGIKKMDIDPTKQNVLTPDNFMEKI